MNNRSMNLSHSNLHHSKMVTHLLLPKPIRTHLPMSHPTMSHRPITKSIKPTQPQLIFQLKMKFSQNLSRPHQLKRKFPRNSQPLPLSMRSQMNQPMLKQPQSLHKRRRKWNWSMLTKMIAMFRSLRMHQDEATAVMDNGH